jgi:hypothetical protein
MIVLFSKVSSMTTRSKPIVEKDATTTHMYVLHAYKTILATVYIAYYGLRRTIFKAPISKLPEAKKKKAI